MKNVSLRSFVVVLLVWWLGIQESSGGTATFDFAEDPRAWFHDYTTTQEDALWSEDGPWAGTGNPGGFLSLTEATAGNSTIVVFPDIDNGQLIMAFNLKMDVRLGNGTTEPPRGGFSVSFARDGDPVFDGFHLPGPVEYGTRTGVVVSFDSSQGDTLTDGSSDIEGITVVVDGVAVKKAPFLTRHGDCDDITSLQTGPQGWIDKDFPRGHPGTLCWAPVEINMTETGLLTVKYKGRIILDQFQSNFFPSAGQLVIASRNGIGSQIQHIDNIDLQTVLAANVECFGNLETLGLDGGRLNFPDVCYSGVDLSNAKIVLDGMDVPSLEISRLGDLRTITFISETPFLADFDHTLIVKIPGQRDLEIGFWIPSEHRGPGSINGISRTADGSIRIEYSGTLQSSGAVNGVYMRVIGASSPYAVDQSSGEQYFIAR